MFTAPHTTEWQSAQYMFSLFKMAVSAGADLDIEMQKKILTLTVKVVIRKVKMKHRLTDPSLSADNYGGIR